MRHFELVEQPFYYNPILLAANLTNKEIVQERIRKHNRTNGISSIFVEQYVEIYV